MDEKKARTLVFAWVSGLLWTSLHLILVPREGLEPSHLSAADFESAASTDSAISADGGGIIPESLFWFKRIRAGKGIREGAGDDHGRAGA